MKSEKDNTNNLFRHRFDSFLNSSIDQVFLTGSVLAIPAIISNIYRNFYFNMPYISSVPAFLLLIVIPVLLILRKKIQYRIKAGIILFFLCSFYILSTILLGLNGYWFFFMLISILFSIIYFNGKTGFYLFVFLFTFFIAAFFLSKFSLIPYYSVPADFYNSGERWVTTLFITLLAVGGVGYLITDYHNFLIKTVSEVSRKDNLEQTISDLNHAKKKIEQSEKQFKEMFRQHSAVMLLIDPFTGKIEDANEAAVKFYGFSYNELCSSSVYNIKTIDKEIISDYLKKLYNKEIDHVELFHKFGDGVIRNIEVYSNPISQLEKPLLFTIVHDITERKKNELEIRKLSIALEQNPASIVITDTNGNIEYVNPMFTSLTGYSSDEVKGEKPSILNSGLTPPETYAGLWKTITEGNIWTGLLYNKKKNGEIFIEKSIISPVKNRKSKIINFLAVKVDITEQKKADELLNESEKKLKALNASKDKFFSIIAHDLRNPFSALLGYSDMLMDKDNPAGDIEKNEYIKNINKTLHITYDLLENLLLWSRSQLENISYNPEKINLKDVVKNNIEFIKGNSDKKNIAIGNSIPDDFEIFADKNMIGTVIRNLLANAVKYSMNSGEIDIKAEIADGKFAEVSVSDSGVGIDKIHLSGIFNIDSNFSTPGTDKENGSGLGLIICRDFVEKNGGKISVRSIKGKGSTFIFTVPL